MNKHDVLGIASFLVVAVVLYALGIFAGYSSGKEAAVIECGQDAVEANAAYYHPKTGEFTWRELKDE